jgi:hypothetical protein
VPCSREDEGLRLPPVPEALNRACPRHHVPGPAPRDTINHAAPTLWMKVPISETTSEINRLRKVDTRRGRHKLDEPRTFNCFSTVPVNRPCLLAAVRRTLARDACTPTVSAKWEQVYTELLGGGPMVLQTALHRNKATVDKHLDSCPSPTFSGYDHSNSGYALLALLYCPMMPRGEISCAFRA